MKKIFKSMMLFANLQRFIGNLGWLTIAVGGVLGFTLGTNINIKLFIIGGGLLVVKYIMGFIFILLNHKELGEPETLGEIALI